MTDEQRTIGELREQLQEAAEQLARYRQVIIMQDARVDQLMAEVDGLKRAAQVRSRVERRSAG